MSAVGLPRAGLGWDPDYFRRYLHVRIFAAARV
jgi:hypothetical protein